MGLISKPRRLDGAAATWSFAEATVFFLVVDILLSFAVVLRGWRAAAWAAVWATLGALLGGLVMFFWSTGDPPAARALVAQVPAISPSMMAKVEAGLAQRGLFDLVVAGVTGTPYKIYAVVAPQLGTSLAAFLIVSGVARLGRFLLAVGLASLADRLLLRFMTRPWRLGVLGGFWVLFYALYWGLVAGA